MKSFLWLILFCCTPFLSIAQTLEYNFEDGNLDEWTQFPLEKWDVSSVDPLSGSNSLKHAPLSGAATDRISLLLPSWDGGQGSIAWRFKVKHGWDPSGSNHWAVFISSDQEAEGMIQTSSPNGYVVGVNLTTTDDILRLYRVDNGIFTPIITSTVNWQIDITKDNIGAIEVERKTDGTFSFKVSKSGHYEDLQIEGNIVDLTYPFGGFFGVYYLYTTSAAGLLWVDDLSFTYKPINPNDNDVIVEEPLEQVEGGTISSLEVNPDEGVDIFRFTIHDQGTSDNLPTYTTRLRFKKVDSPQAAEFQGTIGGIFLKSGGVEIPILSASISDNSIDLLVDKEAMVVEDNSSRELTLSVSLKQGGVVDGSTIQLFIDSENHGWESDIAGSAYSESFPMTVVSNVFTIQVLPRYISFDSYPSEVIINSMFNVSAILTDAYGNISTTYPSEVELSLGLGSGQLTASGSLLVNATNGIVEWSNISYNERDEFSLIASATGLTSDQTEPIAVINDPTSQVVWPTAQPEATPISSLVTTPGQAIEVFRFNIVDEGQNDLVPTHVRQIYIKRPSGTNLASFSGSIAGVTLMVNNEIIPTGSPYILTSSISIPIPDGSLVIPDGESVEVSISVYLKSSGLADGSLLRFMIDSNNHGFVADEKGSTFASTFLNPVLSNDFSIDVEATRLTFSNVPKNVGLNTPFSVEVSAVDNGGSIDVNASDIVSLSKNSGDGDLTNSNPSLQLVGGKASFNNLSYNLPQPFTLITSTANLDDAISPLIYCSDLNSSILPAEIILEDGIINSIAVKPDDAVEVFRFRVSDAGTTDGLPTYITQMVFQTFGVTNSADFSKSIDGVSVSMNGSIVIPLSVSIASGTITLVFDLGEVTIPDGSMVDFSLAVFLRKGGQIDKSSLVLHVPSSNHGWQTSSLGSGFPDTFDAGLVGPQFQIEVNSTNLEFVDQPFVAAVDQVFPLTLAATDAYGSVDRDATSEVKLSLDSGPASFDATSNFTVFQNGIAQWNDIVLHSIGKYKFKAETTFNDNAIASSEPIWCGGNMSCFINENFENGYPEIFPVTDSWKISSVSPIEGGNSLKHNLVDLVGESQLPIPLVINNFGDGPFEWSFVIRNGDWDPTSDNAFWFVLASDTSSFKMGDFNGYAVGVNLSGTSDLLTLWKVNKGGSSEVLIESTFNWNENETVGIKVTRSPDGEWSFWINPNFGVQTYSLIDVALDSSHDKSKFAGPYFKFTASRAGQLWIDELQICTSLYPPIITNAILKNLSTIDLAFSSDVNPDDAAQTQYYSLISFDGSSIDILGVFVDQENSRKVSLRTEQLPLEQMLLKVNGVRSDELSTVVNDSVTVGLGSVGTFGNVIINEIMARPSPTVGLPNFEYIELYNRSSNSIDLSGWKLAGNASPITLPNASIEPNSYLVLTSTSGASPLSEFGPSLGVSSFPSLLDGGMYLAISDEGGNTISWVEYSNAWYGDDTKKAGGYSLERIDPNNLVVGKGNWTGSNDPSGGTPGRENSVFSNNPDQVNPWVVEVKVVDETNIQIGFSEPMDSLSLTLATNYLINGSIGSPVWAISSGPKFDRVYLTLPLPLTPGEIYEICFDDDIRDFSGNSLVGDCETLALPQNPIAGDIVINELLFNPYTGGVDFVELFNRSEKTIDLNKIWIANLDRASMGINEYYLASDSAWLLFPNSFAVLTENPVLVEQFYFVENPDALVWTSKMPAYPNDFGYVLVLDEFGTTIDQFAYTDDLHNKLLSDTKGVSLERINPEMPTNDPSSWESAAQTSGFATPTAENSQFSDPVAVNDDFVLSNQVFSPDGDGFEDVLFINYELPENGYVANIMVFDSKGRRVKRLAANITLGTSGTLKWDGSNDSGSRATIGAYVVFIEAFDLKGNVKRYKKTVVVATKLAN